MIHLVCPNPALDRTLVVDHLQIGVPNRPKQVGEFPGGKSFNVAYALSVGGMGQQVTVHAPLGGRTGQRVSDLARQNGYLLQALPTPTATRMCNILVDASTGQVLPVYERGLDFDAVEGEALRASILTSLQPGDWVVFSGSLPSGLEGSFLASLVTDAKAKGALTAVDASGEALIAAHLSAPTLLKINNEELAELTNSPVDRFACLDEVGKALLSEVSPAIPLAAVTLGPRGVVSRCGNTVFHHADGHLEVRNPVASGDILLGGLLAVLADKSPLLGTTPTFSDDDVDAAVRLGMSWAGSNCLHDFPHVELAEAERHATTITRSRLPI